MNKKNKINKKSKLLKNMVWIYGKHAVKAAVHNKNREISRLVVLESSKDFIEHLDYKAKLLKPEIVDRNFLSAIFGKDATHQGCAVLAKNFEELSLEDILDNESDDRPIIFLDQITDPQNIGSILRASAVFGARAVVVTDTNSPELTPAICKIASGALEVIPLIRVVNFVNSINLLKKNGFWIVGTSENSEKKLDEIDLSGKNAFIIGSEGEGIRRLTRDNCDFLVQLPSEGAFTTLNAAQAATVSLYESLRQRKKRRPE